MRAAWVLARPVLALGMAALTLAGLATRVHADETDNFTCRSQLAIDAQPVLDRRVSDLIQRAVDRANRKRPECDAACLARELRRLVGGSAPSPATLIPHARLALWAAGRDDMDRCRIRFSESIYGARPYDQPWLWPLTHRVIFLADSILLAGHVVGLDKIDHFIREGQVHYDEVKQGRQLEDTLRAALGQSDRPLAMTEYGLRGRALTGVLSYADLAASYAGFLFWRDVLTLDRPGSFVSVEETTNHFVVQRRFTFADYVTEAWDEAINRSEFHPELRRQVDAAVRDRDFGGGLGRDLGRHLTISDCRHLAQLPDARLYVNPECFRGPDPDT